MKDMENNIKYNIGDKVKSSKSLWSNDIGTVSGIVNLESDRIALIHVIFPENDKHYSYQQSFYINDLIRHK